ncbi:MAG TPA: acyl-CoA dehydrogenase family protein [Acidimicrobiia bacterium]|nr:acyl-CoA dehydrogenase family protein [Acidimicrobiia bacterium]
MTATTESVDAIVAAAIDRLLAEHDPHTSDEVTFWGAQFDAGLAWVHFPVGRGGLAVSPSYQTTVVDRLTAAGSSRANVARNVIGYGMGGPTVLSHGTEEQQQRWLRPLFTAEEVWCQLFSEPSAGSDVAGLATRAVRDGDEWVVNGQKVWTTLAHTAKWGMLVARTDPDQPKHRGLTYFIVDMDQPGVDVRPLRQITGEAEFNEVYFTDARIADTDRLGAVGDGWRVALTTLMNERVAIGASIPARGEGPIAMAVDLWQSHGSDPAHRDRLMQLWVEAEVLRLTNVRAARARTLGTPGPEGSTAKLHWAELNKEIYEFCVDVMGPDGLLYPETYAFRVPDESAMGRRSPQMNFLRARANSIEGGTSEIMKNILGERVLGLPGEPRVDKDLPWRDVPRG